MWIQGILGEQSVSVLVAEESRLVEVFPVWGFDPGLLKDGVDKVVDDVERSGKGVEIKATHQLPVWKNWRVIVLNVNFALFTDLMEPRLRSPDLIPA